MEKLYLELCRGRHSIPGATDGAVFENTLADIAAVLEMEETALKRLSSLIASKNKAIDTLNLYVTGFTPALVATINAAHRLGLKIILWHYNRDTDNFFPQEVMK